MSSPRKKFGRAWVHDVTQFRGWSDSLKKAFDGWTWNAQYRFGTVYERHLQMCLTEQGIKELESLRASRAASVSTYSSQIHKLMTKISETIKALSRLNQDLAAACRSEDTARVALCVVDQKLGKAKQMLIQKRVHYDQALDGLPISSRVHFDQLICMDEEVMKQCADCTFRRLSNFNPNFSESVVSLNHDVLPTQCRIKLEDGSDGAERNEVLEESCVVPRPLLPASDCVTSSQLLKNPEACGVLDEGVCDTEGRDFVVQREDGCMNRLENNEVSAFNRESMLLFDADCAVRHEFSQHSVNSGDHCHI